jgi:hypothetical protein
MNSSTRPPDRDWISNYKPDDPELHAAIRRRYTRVRWITVPVAVAAVIATRAGLESTVGSDLDETSSRVPDWLVLPVTMAFLAAAVIVVAAIAIALRPARRAAVRRNPRPVLSRAESRRVGQQLAGRAPVAPHEMPFLRDVALGTYAGRRGVVLLAGIVLLCAARATVVNSADAVLAGVAGLILAVIGVFALRSVVRARRFLRSIGVAPV